MEKIQSAIAKARAARENAAPPMSAQVLPHLNGGRLAAQASDIAPAVPQEAVAEGAARTRLLSSAQVMTNWQRLSSFEPDPRQMQDRRIVAFQGGREAVTFDVMRTKLLQQMRANNWRRLAITSPSAACGKSTTCMNLAFSLSRQPEIRTVLAEVDLRRPSISKALGIKPQVSFADVLMGNEPFERCATRFGDNLCFATNVTAARNPSELLQSPHVPEALAAIEANYEPTIMIFDMPPMLVSDDAMAFVGQVDCVLLVAAAEATTIQEVDVCERDLAAQTNVIGVVLNKCRYLDRRYGYSYYG